MPLNVGRSKEQAWGAHIDQAQNEGVTTAFLARGSRHP
jgi:hypothetical protein